MTSIAQVENLGIKNELDTAYLTGELTDHLGVPIPAASITTLKLWITDEATGVVVNSRNGLSILNANGGTLDATSGAWTLTLASADNPILNPAASYERHRILIVWTYSGGAQQGSFEGILTIRNLSQIP